MSLLSLLPLLAVLALSALSPARCLELIYSDDFDTLDESRWEHLNTAWRGGNWEFQYYRNDRKNSYVRDGILYIKPTLTADEFGDDFVEHGSLSIPDCNMEPCVSQAAEEVVAPVQSARISTQNKFSFKYGRLEVRAKMPKGDWLWPAIWLLPEDEVYGTWPRSGEIDLVESRGNRNMFDAQGRQEGIRSMASTLHFGPAWNINGFEKTHFTKFLDNDTLADDFHVYTLDWTEDRIRFYLDDQLIGRRDAPEGGFWKLGGFDGEDIWSGQTMAPFNQKFYIIMNVAVGGTTGFFGDDLRNEPYSRPWDPNSGHAMRQFWDNRALWLPTWQDESAAMQVDYLRVYSH